MRSDDDQVGALPFGLRQHFVANTAPPRRYFHLIIADAKIAAPLSHGRQSVLLFPRVKIAGQKV